MNPQLKFLMKEKGLPPTAEGGTSRVRTAVASGMWVDRERDLVLPQGLDATNFMSNPVMLDSHNYYGKSIGKVLDIRATDHEVEFDFVFADTEDGRLLAYLYDHGFQNAFSVGFIAKSFIDVPADSADVLSIKVGGEDGREVQINLSDFPEPPKRVITGWELLEISAVAVPALPQALLRQAKGVLGYLSGQAADPEQAQALKGLADRLEYVVEEQTASKMAVPSHSTPIDGDSPWDADAAMAALAKWASSDGSGDRDTIDWGKYAKGFAWYDSEARETFGAYKLPHHTVVDGKLVAVWRGVTAAMAALNGARGGVDIPEGDRQAVYRHLARHYQDAEAEPPELRGYTEEELKAIEEQPLPSLGQEPEEPQDPTLSPDVVSQERLDAALAGLEERLVALERVVREVEIGLRIKLGVFMEEVRSMAASSVHAPASAPHQSAGAQSKVVPKEGQNHEMIEWERKLEGLANRLMAS